MSTAKERFQAFKKSYEEAKAKMQDEAEAAFKELAADLFESIPEMQSFGWVQYTPYFNDGDTCEFSVDTYDVYVNGSRSDEDDFDEDEELDEATMEKSQTAVSEFLNQFDEDILKTMFGDHAKVTIRRSGEAEVDEYDHE